MIMSSVPSSPNTMAKPSPSKPSFFSDVLLFFGGAAVALLLFLTFYTFFMSPNPSVFNFELASSKQRAFVMTGDSETNLDQNLYDDLSVTYTVSKPLENWDEKRAGWFKAQPGFTKERILMVSGSQPGPCRNPIGDHLLLKFFKNKVDYCRLHGIELFYNTALLEPEMFSFWAKIPVVRAAMVAHPEAEWIWWVDSDACFTDMEFELPLERYKDYNLVLHGWPHLVFEAKSWTSLNAGVFLMRNCQWSIDFIDTWSKMGPQSKDYEQWGEIQRSVFKDKLFEASDDQTGIAYLLLKQRDKWGDKMYLENEFYFEGYWLEIFNKLERIEQVYFDMEKKHEILRSRKAENSAVANGRIREGYLEKEGIKPGIQGWKRPFVTHFTGCQPCSGDHNKEYSGANCYEGMQKALNFADNQVLRAYGFRHERLFNSTKVQPLPFDFPKA